MSFLTTFPEDVYPQESLATTVRPGPFDIALARALMWVSQAAYEVTADEPGAAVAKRKLERILENRWSFACRSRLRGGFQNCPATRFATRNMHAA